MPGPAAPLSPILRPRLPQHELQVASTRPLHCSREPPDRFKMAPSGQQIHLQSRHLFTEINAGSSCPTESHLEPQVAPTLPGEPQKRKEVPGEPRKRKVLYRRALKEEINTREKPRERKIVPGRSPQEESTRGNIE